MNNLHINSAEDTIRGEIDYFMNDGVIVRTVEKMKELILEVVEIEKLKISMSKVDALSGELFEEWVTNSPFNKL